jgi:recombination protein RecR
MSLKIEKLTELFLEFPGIGRRQAQRFVYALLHKDQAYINELIQEISSLKQEIQQCSECYRFYPRNGNQVCNHCVQAEPQSLLVVEKDADLENIERTGLYRGKFFVLGGYISSHEKRKSFARTEALTSRIERDVKNGTLQELIFGLSISPEAEHTRLRLLSLLKDKYPQLSFSSLGRGLSTGTELEYSDSETLRYALTTRIPN